MAFIRSILGAAFLVAVPLAAAADGGGQITVSGQGQVSAVPDMARIEVGVYSIQPKANEAMEELTSNLNGVFEQLDEMGIDPTDIQTSGLSLSAERDYRSNDTVPKITGYSARSTVSLRVRELDRLGVILDRVLGAGANEMQGLRFEIEDRAALETAAQQAAVANAAQKAQTFAEAAGVELGALMLLNEGGSRGPSLPFEMSARMEDAAVPIASGDITISASVTMTYAIGSPD